MPYIKQEDRVALYFEPSDTPQTPGELNFVITSIAHRYIQEHGQTYGVFNSVIGALECAKMELYRRRVAPYEDKKIEENGDVEF